MVKTDHSMLTCVWPVRFASNALKSETVHNMKYFIIDYSIVFS